MTPHPDPDPARWDAPDDAACRQPSTAQVPWFPDRTSPDYDAGAAAMAVCRTCPYVEPCVTAAVARREVSGGIFGGTGGATRRALRRHWGTPRWPDALAAHLRWLRGEPPRPGDAELRRAAGAERTHGLRSTFAAGCRESCDLCSMAAGVEGQMGGGGLGSVLAARKARREAA